MKAKIVWAILLLALAAVSLTIYYSVTSAFLSPRLVLEREKGLAEKDLILVETGAKGNAFHLGDAIFYSVRVLYNPEKVEEIDRSSIDKSLILKPFKIRNQSEKDFKVDSRTRVWLKEYEIQLLDGPTNQLYFFPTITVRYKIKDSNWFDKKVILEPIFIGSRVPLDVTGLKLKSQEGRVINMSRSLVPWVFWGWGFLFSILGIHRFAKIIGKQKREKEEEKKRMKGLADIYEAYLNLRGRDLASPDLHQVLQILRCLLSRKEGIDWLEPNLNAISPEIKQPVISLLEMCQKAYQREGVESQEVEMAVKTLGEIFDFYIKKRGA